MTRGTGDCQQPWPVRSAKVDADDPMMIDNVELAAALWLLPNNNTTRKFHLGLLTATKKYPEAVDAVGGAGCCLSKAATIQPPGWGAGISASCRSQRKENAS